MLDAHLHCGTLARELGRFDYQSGEGGAYRRDKREEQSGAKCGYGEGDGGMDISD